MARLRAADVLALVAAAAIPLIFLHSRYQAHLAVRGVDVYSSDLAVVVVLVAAAIAGLRFGWEPLRRGRTLWLLAAALFGLLLVSCFWRPVETLGTHLTTWGKLVEYALLAPAVVLLFRRAVDLDRFLVVFVGWAVAAGLWGALMFFGIVDDPQGPRPGQREVSFLGHQDYGAFTGAALAVGLAAIALGARRRLAVAAVIGGGLGVALDASIFAYLGTILAAIAIVVVTRRLGHAHAPADRGARSDPRRRRLGRFRAARIGRLELPLVPRRLARAAPPTRECKRASSGRCSSGWAGRCGRTTRSSGSGSTGRTPTSSRTSLR